MNQKQKSPTEDGANSKVQNESGSTQALYPNVRSVIGPSSKLTHMQSPLLEFQDAMFAAGLIGAISIIPDGEIHRFRSEGDKRPNAWYVLFDTGGAFGNWRTGLKQKWHWGNISRPDRRKANARIKAAQKAHREARAQRQEQAAVVAQRDWQIAIPATHHRYLQAKRVNPHRTGFMNSALLVPMCIDRKLWNLQRINPDGSKYFMKDARVKGTYFPIGTLGSRLWIAEGFSTGATVHEITGDAVACAMSGGNMAEVAAWFSNRYPEVELLIAADAGETGIKCGQAAMKAGYAKRMVYPDFPHGDQGSDWNDFFRLYGADQTRLQLAGAGGQG